MNFKHKSFEDIKRFPSTFKCYRSIKLAGVCLTLLALAVAYYRLNHYPRGPNLIKDGRSVSGIRFQGRNLPVLINLNKVLHPNDTLCINLSVESKNDKLNTKGNVSLEQNYIDYISNFSNNSAISIKTSTVTRSPTARQRLPQAIIIGMSKAGTRALNDYLRLNSNIRGTKREVHFFDRDANYSKGYEWYKAQLAYSEQGQITIERTPRYVVSQKVPERIFKMNSSIKILLIVREPLTRALSEYVHNVADNVKYRRKTFEQYAIKRGTGEINTEYKPISKSVYFHHMPKWYRYFSQDQIYIVDGDNLIVNPVQELQKVERFLGVIPEITENNIYFNKTKGFYCFKKFPCEIPRCLGKNKGRQHPNIKPEVVKKLHEFFRPWNEKFFQQIGRRFSWP